MPLIQGGPPEWIWERTANLLKWELRPAHNPEGRAGYELRVSCGLEVVRLQFFTADEMRELQVALNEGLTVRADGLPADEGRDPRSSSAPALSTPHR